MKEPDHVSCTSVDGCGVGDGVGLGVGVGAGGVGVGGVGAGVGPGEDVAADAEVELGVVGVAPPHAEMLMAAIAIEIPHDSRFHISLQRQCPRPQLWSCCHMAER